MFSATTQPGHLRNWHGLDTGTTTKQLRAFTILNSNVYLVLGNGSVFTTSDNQTSEEIVPLRHKTIVSVHCGLRHVVAIDGQGHLWAWGHNEQGQLGDNATRDDGRAEPVAIDIDEPVVDVQCGRAHTLALTKSGRLWVWGSNRHGQLGLEDTKQVYPVPVPLTRFDRVAQILATENGSLVLAGNGTVFEMTTDHDDSSVHGPINPVMLNIRSISGTRDHFYMLAPDGQIYVLHQKRKRAKLLLESGKRFAAIYSSCMDEDNFLVAQEYNNTGTVYYWPRVVFGDDQDGDTNNVTSEYRNTSQHLVSDVFALYARPPIWLPFMVSPLPEVVANGASLDLVGIVVVLLCMMITLSSSFH